MRVLGYEAHEAREHVGYKACQAREHVRYKSRRAGEHVAHEARKAREYVECVILQTRSRLIELYADEDICNVILFFQ